MKALKKEGQDLECDKQEIQDIREAKVISRIMVKVDSRVIAVHQDHRIAGLVERVSHSCRTDFFRKINW